MKVPSVLQMNVSEPKIVDWNGNMIATGIFKTPVSGKVKVRKLNLEEGEIETGDEIVVTERDSGRVRLSDVSRCFLDPGVDADLVAKVMDSKLARQMKEHLEYRLSGG